MRRLLFLDDCPQMLRSLEFAMELEGYRWISRFASDGAEALRMMRAEGFDVVIADLNMPGMDGKQFLQQAIADHPATLRVVMTGYPEEAIWAKASGLAHMHLEKPYRASALIRTIERCLELQDSARASRALSRNLSTRNLPSSPICYQRLVQALTDPSLNPAAIHRIIASDPAMAARMLQIVNTIDSTRERTVTTVEDAIERLGYESLRTLVAAKDLFIQFAVDGPAGETLSALQRDACRVAVIAREIANLADASSCQAKQAYIAGLLLNIGSIARLQNEPATYRELAANSGPDGPKRLDAACSELGTHLLRLWGFAEEIVQAIAAHDQPERGAEGCLSLSAICHLAAALGFGRYRWRERVDWAFFEGQGFARPQIELWADAVLELATAKREREPAPVDRPRFAQPIG